MWAGFAILDHKTGLHRRRRFEDLNSLETAMHPKSSLREFVPMAFAGVMLVTAFAFAGHYIGRNADAHNAAIDESAPLVMPTSALATKGSLLPEGETFALLNVKTLRSQTVLIDGKGDLVGLDIVAPVPVPKPKPKPVKIASVEKDGKLERPYLGIHYVSLTDDYAYTYNLSVKRGAYIAPGLAGQSSIISGSPAEKAGLKEKDIITAINGINIDENNSLVSILGRSQVGDKVNLTVNRGGKELKITTTLEAAPQQ